jgi:peptidoglycan-associated lipoprotein
MNLFKALVVGATVALLSACSTTNMNDSEATNASQSQIDELENRVGDRVFFEFDSSAVNAEAQEILKKQAAFMAQNSDLKFAIEGHCDERGTREYNLALGERRANAVKQHLVSLGVDASRLSTVSFGKERPAVVGTNEWAWGQNRRGVTVAK